MLLQALLLTTPPKEQQQCDRKQNKCPCMFKPNNNKENSCICCYCYCCCCNLLWHDSPSNSQPGLVFLFVAPFIVLLALL